VREKGVEELDSHTIDVSVLRAFEDTDNSEKETLVRALLRNEKAFRAKIGQDLLHPTTRKPWNG
jgi:hypothetical protein